MSVKHIAHAAIKQAIAEGYIKTMSEAEIHEAINKTMWTPQYEEYLFEIQ